MRKFFLIVLFVLPALHQAVSSSGNSSPSVQYVMKSLERASTDCRAGGKPCVTIRVEYPLFQSAPTAHARDSLNMFIQEVLLGKYDPAGVEPVLDAVRDTVVGEYRGLQRNDSTYAFPWVIERRMHVVGDTLGILTIDVSEYRFTGGAHPNSMELLYMVDARSVHVLSLDDLTTPESRGKIRVLAERAFRRVRKLKPSDDLAKKGFTFEGGKFVLTMNVGLIPEGLLFYYNAYEIAPYVMGPTRVVVPWRQAGHLLSQDPRGK